jgi:hypothetical protein
LDAAPFLVESGLFWLVAATDPYFSVAFFSASVVASSSFFLEPAPIEVVGFGNTFFSTGFLLSASAGYSFPPKPFLAACYFFSSSGVFFLSIVAGLVAFGSTLVPTVAPTPAFLASAELIWDVTPPAFSLSLIA